MHLTNYSINKHSDGFQKTNTEDSGSKRSLKYFNEYLRQRDYDVSFLWNNIRFVEVVHVPGPWQRHPNKALRCETRKPQSGFCALSRAGDGYLFLECFAVQLRQKKKKKIERDS